MVITDIPGTHVCEKCGGLTNNPNNDRLCRGCARSSAKPGRPACSEVCKQRSTSLGGHDAACPSGVWLANQACPNHDYGTCDSYGCTFGMKAEPERGT